MIITHDTTVEEYEAWLATNPNFTDFKVAVRATFRVIYKTLGGIERLLSKVTHVATKRRISHTIYPFTYEKNARYTRANFYRWLRGVSVDLAATTHHIRRLEMFNCLEDKSWGEKAYSEKQARIAQIEQDVAMDGLAVEALEILNNSNY